MQAIPLIFPGNWCPWPTLFLFCLLIAMAGSQADLPLCLVRDWDHTLRDAAMSSSGKGAASLEPDDFRKQLFAQLHASGVVNSLKSQLRTQMLAQLQSRYAAGVQPPSDEKPSLARRAVNSLIAEYLGWSKYDYTLSIFQPESGLSSSSAAALSAEEIMQARQTVMQHKTSSCCSVAAGVCLVDSSSCCDLISTLLGSCAMTMKLGVFWRRPRLTSPICDVLPSAQCFAHPPLSTSVCKWEILGQQPLLC